MSDTPPLRLRALNAEKPAPGGDYVLYWMIAYRRSTWNFALQRAIEMARQFERPLVILEALRCDYPYASDRLHRFALEGMSCNRRAFEKAPVLYHPYVEPHRGAGKGLLAALAAKACLVVTDDYPAFFLPHMVGAAAQKLPVLLEAVDSNGLLPMRAADRDFPTAYAFRRFLQKNLPAHLLQMPRADPLRGANLPKLEQLPEDILKRWPPPEGKLLQGCRTALAQLPIDHQVAPAPAAGGAKAAVGALRRFLRERLADYATLRNQPQREATSGLSPYLHFGHISAHQVFSELAIQQNWSVGNLSPETRGKKSGWWGMSEPAEAFLDQLVTWRELGFNMCAFREDYDRYASLPDWARATLEEHEGDIRPYLYDKQELEGGRTHDGLWNAAQMQLVREGRMHNYLRMLWGKKILEWSPTPRRALEVMIELNDRYALDGRDPNSCSGIFWCLGRYDRPWGPQRPIFGKIRYMSSENTARKVDVKGYVERYAP